MNVIFAAQMNFMIKTGEYNILKVLRQVDFGVYLDDGAEGILLPKMEKQNLRIIKFPILT